MPRERQSRRFRVAALALAALGAVACAAPQGAGRPADPAPSREPAAHGLARVQSSRDIDGRPVGPAGRGEQATLVVVFASWCHPCRRELAMLGEVAAPDSRIRILGLNAYESWHDRSDQERLRAFLADSAPWLRVVHADDRMLAAFGGVPKIPTMFVYDGGGHLVRAFRRDRRRPPTREELEQALAAALR